MPQPTRRARRQRPQPDRPHATDSTNPVWDDAVEKFLATKYGDNVTKATLTNYRWSLTGPNSRAFRADHKIEFPRDLTAEKLERFKGELFGADLSAHTVHQFTRTHKTFASFCIDRGYGPDASVLDVKEPKLDLKEPEIFSASDEKKLLAAAKTPRDRLLVEFMLHTGLRLSEVCNVELDDIDEAGTVVRVHQGKGRKDRSVPLNTPQYDLSKKLRRFIATERVKSSDPHLFLTSRKAGRAGEYAQLTPRAVQVLLRRLGDEAGVNANPHKFRHTFATRALASGVDPLALMRVLGHTSLTMVNRYVHFQTDDLLAAWARRSD